MVSKKIWSRYSRERPYLFFSKRGGSIHISGLFSVGWAEDFVGAVLDISARPLAQASVKSVGRVQILDHSPVWRVQFSSPRNYLTIKIKNVFTLHFGTKIPKHKLTISILQ